MGSMHITAVDAITVNGKITRGEDADAHTWTSPEDWEHFVKLRDSFDLLVMGRGTYDAVQPKPENERLRIILTHHPEAYTEKVIPGQLEFMNTSPEELIETAETRGFSSMLLVGGQVNTQFWDRGLVDEAYITIEPHIFSQGRNFLDGLRRENRLQLQSARQLNERGAMLLHYLVDSQAPNTLS